MTQTQPLKQVQTFSAAPISKHIHEELRGIAMISREELISDTLTFFVR